MTVAPLPGQQPFLWGRGGKRMSMDDIALRRRLAAQQMAQGSDYSPVGHWTQGLARVANGLAGSVNMGRADKAEAAQRDAQQEIIEALLAPETMPSTGRPILHNPDGSISTEESITITDPRLNAGAPTNIPSIWNGRRTASEDEAIAAALASGQQFQSFPTIDDAVAAAKARSEGLGREYQQSPDAAIAAALADPELRQLGMSVLEARRKPAWEPNNDFERALIESGVERGSPEWRRYNAMRREGIADPVIFGEVAGRNFAGPRSWVVEDIMGGGDPASGAFGAAAPQASYPAPPQEAVLELLQNPDTASQFDEVFGPGAAERALAGQTLGAAYNSRTITQVDAARIRASLGPGGQAAFEKWMRDNNIVIGGQ